MSPVPTSSGDGKAGEAYVIQDSSEMSSVRELPSPADSPPGLPLTSDILRQHDERVLKTSGDFKESSTTADNVDSRSIDSENGVGVDVLSQSSGDSGLTQERHISRLTASSFRMPNQLATPQPTDGEMLSDCESVDHRQPGNDCLMAKRVVQFSTSATEQYDAPLAFVSSQGGPPDTSDQLDMVETKVRMSISRWEMHLYRGDFILRHCKAFIVAVT